MNNPSAKCWRGQRVVYLQDGYISLPSILRLTDEIQMKLCLKGNSEVISKFNERLGTGEANSGLGTLQICCRGVKMNRALWN